MNALEELQQENAHGSYARFFLRIGQAGRAAEPRDDRTLPLFPLPLIMDAEGILARDARHLVHDNAEYLRRCHALIRSVRLDFA